MSPASRSLIEFYTPSSLPGGSSNRYHPAEKLWSDRQPFLAERGYELRPRYRPGWKPSWAGTKVNPAYCEDSIRQIIPMIMDATRSDGALVCIKFIEKRSSEVDIARFLSSDTLLHHPNNHTVPIFDFFQDPFLPEVDHIVMPLLRPFDDPEFGTLGEVVDFVSQILEGLAFMHSHDVAHRDLAGPNIMMDGRPLYPNGWHPVYDKYSRDGIDRLNALARIDHPVRYYFIDFGLSSRFLPGQAHLVVGLKGRDHDVPELSDVDPYNPFKVDIFIIGNLLLKDFQQKFLGLDFLSPLISGMIADDPDQRPTAVTALEHWESIRGTLSPSAARWRLRKPDETTSGRIMRDTVAVAREGFQTIKRLLRDNAQSVDSGYGFMSSIHLFNRAHRFAKVIRTLKSSTSRVVHIE